MIEKFNNIFYLTIYLVHFAGTGMYAFQTLINTKKFMKKFGIDKSGAVAIRFAGAVLLAVFLMSVYVGFIRTNGLNAPCAFFNIHFINNLCILLCNYYSINVKQTAVLKKTVMA